MLVSVCLDSAVDLHVFSLVRYHSWLALVSGTKRPACFLFIWKTLVYSAGATLCNQWCRRDSACVHWCECASVDQWQAGSVAVSHQSGVCFCVRRNFLGMFAQEVMHKMQGVCIWKHAEFRCQQFISMSLYIFSAFAC